MREGERESECVSERERVRERWREREGEREREREGRRERGSGQKISILPPSESRLPTFLASFLHSFLKAGGSVQ